MFSDLLPEDYTVYVLDSMGCVLQVTVTVSFSIGVSPIDKHVTVTMNPNPVDYLFYTVVEGLTNVEGVMVRIISTEGKNLRFRKLARANTRYEGHVSMVGLEAGAYYVQVLADNKVYYTTKVIKN